MAVMFVLFLLLLFRIKYFAYIEYDGEREDPKTFDTVSAPISRKKLREKCVCDDGL